MGRIRRFLDGDWAITLTNTKHTEVTMNHPVSIPLQRPLVERWAQDVGEFIVRALRQRRARRDLDRRIKAMADLSGAVLRDIGGPDDLVNQAAARRQADAQCLEELRIIANYRGVDSRFW
jgi:hypothetical protein